MKILIALLLLTSTAAIAQDSQYCDLGQRTENAIDGFDTRFCFGTKEYMEAFAKTLEVENIPHYVYKNGDIGYHSRFSSKVQEIGDRLLYEYIFTSDGKIKKNL